MECVVVCVKDELLFVVYSLYSSAIFTEYTNFDHTSCYVVTRVIMAQTLRLEMSQDGEVYYDSSYKGPRPICYQVARVKLRRWANGALKSIKPVTGRVPFYVTGRRAWHTFFASFIPNQESLGKNPPA